MAKLASRFGGYIDWIAVVPPDGAERHGVVQLAHGMAEHKARYLPFMEYLASRGYAAVMSDHRGHGASVDADADLGYLGPDGYIAMVEDLHDVTLTVKADASLYTTGQPYFLFGHSMGALAVRSYAKRYDSELDGLLISGCPSNNPIAGAGLLVARLVALVRGQRYRSKLLAAIAGGSLNKSFKTEGSDFAWLSANRDNVAIYDADPLCGYTFTTNGYIGLIELLRDCYSDWKASRPEIPVLFVSGEDDPCMVNRSALDNAVERMRAAGYTDVELRLFTDMRHEILQETERESVFADIADTLDMWAGVGAVMGDKR